MIILILL